MKIDKDRFLTAALAMFFLAGASGISFAKLSPEQASLRGVESITVHISCSESAAEIGFSEKGLLKAIQGQLEDAGIKVRPAHMWAALPGRCRLRVAVKVYKPANQDIFVYNLRVDFLQTVALQRSPGTQIDAVTWDLTWFAHGSESALAQAIPQNLEVLAASFVKDYRQANPKRNKAPEPKSGSDTGKSEFTGSKGSDVFHKSQCRWASSIASENLVSYKSRQDAVKAGKRPCKQCNP